MSTGLRHAHCTAGSQCNAQPPPAPCSTVCAWHRPVGAPQPRVLPACLAHAHRLTAPVHGDLSALPCISQERRPVLAAPAQLPSLSFPTMHTYTCAQAFGAPGWMLLTQLSLHISVDVAAQPHCPQPHTALGQGRAGHGRRCRLSVGPWRTVAQGWERCRVSIAMFCSSPGGSSLWRGPVPVALIQVRNIGFNDLQNEEAAS